jgi:hypothetical protein
MAVALALAYPRPVYLVGWSERALPNDDRRLGPPSNAGK